MSLLEFLPKIEFVNIPSLSFFGQYSVSPSGEWCICWADSDLEFHSGRGGCRESGRGLFVLYNKFREEIILKGWLERPQRAKVTDTGIFCIEDWRFMDQLKSTVYAISPRGEILIDQTFEGNLFNSDISTDGQYLVCQTANNQHSSDGNLLTLFDVLKKKILFSRNPITGWANQYIFMVNSSKLGVVHDGIGTYYYDMQGNFLDQDRYNEEQLTCDKYEVVIFRAQDLLKSPDLNEESIYKIITAMNHSLEILPKNEYHYSSWAALAFKVQGEAYEFIGNKTQALYCFERALELNHKIGVKRKIEKIRKELTLGLK